MKHPTRWLSFIGALVILGANANLSLAEEVKPEIIGPYLSPNHTSTGISFVYDDFRDPRNATASFLADWNTMYPDPANPWVYNPNTVKYCTSLTDEVCSKATKFEAVAFMPACVGPEDNYCVESIYAVVNEKRIDGVLKSNYPKTTLRAFKGDAKYNLASGSTSTIWTIPGVKNAAGNEDYLISTYLAQTGQRNPDGTLQPFKVKTMTLGFYAINMLQGPYSDLLPNGSGIDGITQSGCAVTELGSCAKRSAFAENTRYGIVLRFATPPVSWFYGRMSRAVVDTEVKPYGLNLTVEAEPVYVPIAAGFSTWNNLPTYLQDFYQRKNNNGIGFGTDGMPVGDDPTKWDFGANHTSDDFGSLKAWMPLVKDQAAIMSPQFFLRSVPSDSMGNLARCFTSGNQVNGLVTSNATAYTPGPPNFDQQAQSLDYEMASPHYTAAGNLSKGSYDLSIRSSVASCIYGFKDNVPIKASISIVGGSSDIATELISNKNGWFRLGAYGFTFSQPKLRVKLTQDLPTPTQNNNGGMQNNNGGMQNNNGGMQNNNGGMQNNNGMQSSVMKPAAKTISIKCVKGKTVKTVSGTNPKCPAGYTKK